MKSEHYLLTLSAFTIATALIDNLTGSEQNALGNWFMLVGQTLCTNGSFNFNKEWKAHLNTNIESDKLLQKTRDAIDNHIKNNTGN